MTREEVWVRAMTAALEAFAVPKEERAAHVAAWLADRAVIEWEKRFLEHLATAREERAHG